MKKQTTLASMPYAYITKEKKRVKQFDQTVYLKNGDEFEIELFNPTTNRVLAKIEINNTPIGNTGIVLRPGERVYLERYLNDAKKFLFETYMVNGDNSEVEHAIKYNGDVVVKFYQETVEQFNSILYNTSNNIEYTPIRRYFVPQSFSSLNSSELSDTKNTSATLSFFDQKLKNRSRGIDKNTNDIETGRIEKGSHSNQTFTSVNLKFNPWSISESVWKILPETRKMLTSDDIVVYCTECGHKRKKPTHKFCPMCGNKF